MSLNLLKCCFNRVVFEPFCWKICKLVQLHRVASVKSPQKSLAMRQMTGNPTSSLKWEVCIPIERCAYGLGYGWGLRCEVVYQKVW